MEKFINDFILNFFMEKDNMGFREFLRNLRKQDRKDLIGVLKILKEHNLDVIARGSSVQKGHNRNYKDIDLLVRGDPNEFDEAVRNVESFKFMPYTPVMGSYVGEGGIKTTARFYDLDISYCPDKKIRDDVPKVDLLVNPGYRE